MCVCYPVNQNFLVMVVPLRGDIDLYVCIQVFKVGFIADMPVHVVNS